MASRVPSFLLTHSCPLVRPEGVKMAHLTAIFLCLFSLLSPFSYVYARTSTCKPIDLSILRAQVTFPKPFCRYYLSKSRIRSPIDAFDAATLTRVCRCIVPDYIAKRSVEVVKREPSPPVRYECNYYNLAVIEQQFEKTRPFCTYWTAM